jgi:hypothetical protein
MDQRGVDLGKGSAESIRELVADNGPHECGDDSACGLLAGAKQLKT